MNRYDHLRRQVQHDPLLSDEVRADLLAHIEAESVLQDRLSAVPVIRSPTAVAQLRERLSR